MSIFEEFESDEDLEPGQQEVLNALRQLKVYMMLCVFPLQLTDLPTQDK